MRHTSFIFLRRGEQEPSTEIAKESFGDRLTSTYLDVLTHKGNGSIKTCGEEGGAGRAEHSRSPIRLSMTLLGTERLTRNSKGNGPNGMAEISSVLWKTLTEGLLVRGKRMQRRGGCVGGEDMKRTAESPDVFSPGWRRVEVEANASVESGKEKRRPP